MTDLLPCEGCAFARDVLIKSGGATVMVPHDAAIPPHRPDCPAAQTTVQPGGVRVYTYAESDPLPLVPHRFLPDPQGRDRCASMPMTSSGRRRLCGRPAREHDDG